MHSTLPKAIVLGGKTGLLGMSLTRILREEGWHVSTPSREELDLGNADAVAEYIDTIEPEYLFNTVAYTRVDLAEDEKNEAMHVNRCLPSMLGRLMQQRPTFVFHYSTDFVFNGNQETPYTENDTTNPQSVYGSTKLAGEEALLKRIPDQCCIARTAWLFGPGKGNFVQTMLRLCRQRDSVTVVDDQIGSPTYTPDLAQMSLALAKTKTNGIFHLVNNGQASWCELAAEAASLAEIHCDITPISSTQYPQKAQRPAYSVLDTSRFTECTGITPRPWPQALRDYIFLDLENE